MYIYMYIYIYVYIVSLNALCCVFTAEIYFCILVLLKNRRLIFACAHMTCLKLLPH